MTRVALLLTFRAQPGKRDALVAHLSEAGASYANESGTEAFIVHVSPMDAEVVHVYELYASPQAQRLHESAPGYAATRARTTELLAGPPTVTPMSVAGGKLP